MVDSLERAASQLRCSDDQFGAGSSREAAVGQLKYATDLMKHASYDQATGSRLLYAIAELAGRVGWLSYDAGMHGPAQRYFVYTLQAARESGDERAGLRSAGTLISMARQLQSVGQPDTAVRLVELALDHLPTDRRRYSAVRSCGWGFKARLLASMGSGHTPEACSAIGLAFELFTKAADEAPDPGVLPIRLPGG